tara:strand:- start:1873 stop:2667 length:795 start_codon:yes stop_codon:yes gene_type:complete
MSWWDNLVDFGGDLFDTGLDFFTSPKGLAYLGGMGLSMGSFGETKIPQTGYQGGIPDYQVVRERVPMQYDPNRRPGSMGQRYFSDAIFAQAPEDRKPMTVEEAKAKAAEQLAGLASLNTGNREATRRPIYTTNTMASSNPASAVINTMPVDTGEEDEIQTTGNRTGGVANMYGGGITSLNKGRYLGGMTDGMADKVPASINGTQPAALSDGEFVIPADVVSHLGNGNSNAGAKQLDQMMSRVRKKRTGNAKQGKQIKPNNFLPA